MLRLACMHCGARWESRPELRPIIERHFARDHPAGIALRIVAN